MSEVGCELLVVGPSAKPGLCHWMSRTSESQCGNSGCQAGEALWTERRAVATYWFFVLEFGCPTVAGDVLVGAEWLGAADWDRRVPVTVGEVAVSLQAGRAGADSAGCGAGVSRWSW